MAISLYDGSILVVEDAKRVKKTLLVEPYSVDLAARMKLAYDNLEVQFRFNVSDDSSPIKIEAIQYKTKEYMYRVTVRIRLPFLCPRRAGRHSLTIKFLVSYRGFDRGETPDLLCPTVKGIESFPQHYHFVSEVLRTLEGALSHGGDAISISNKADVFHQLNEGWR